jgi:hypothetical protein
VDAMSLCNTVTHLSRIVRFRPFFISTLVTCFQKVSKQMESVDNLMKDLGNYMFYLFALGAGFVEGADFLQVSDFPLRS